MKNQKSSKAPKAPAKQAPKKAPQTTSNKK